MKPVTKPVVSVAVFVVAEILVANLARASVVSPIISPIYGNDDRQDLYQVTDPALLKMADSTVALIEESHLTLDASGTQFKELGSSLKDRHNMCSGERFVDQLALAFCSGSLVGPDLVMTAGHCIEDMDDCKTTRIAFGFSLRKGSMTTGTLPASEVYSCSDIVSRAQDIGGADYAVIRLDRAVKGHQPLAISRTGAIELGTPLVVVGHPSGIPAKVAGGAFVRDNTDAFKFVANLDTYHGNSGSPVFNARTGLIEGILVSGEDDYDFDEAAQCYRDKRCADDGCKGEKSTRVSFPAPYIPELPRQVPTVNVQPPSTPAHPPVIVPPAPQKPRLVCYRHGIFRRLVCTPQ